MATITWGKPLVEYASLVNGELPTNPTWTAFDNPVEDSTTLETTEGDVMDAYAEGHELVDRKVKKSTYVLSLSLFNKGGNKPIEDEDGVINDQYAVRLTPEDSTKPGFIFKKSNVSVTDTWSSADGERWNYKFTALKPASGNMKEPYLASQ